MLTINNSREIRELTAILNEVLTLRLYTNNVTPDGTTVSGDLTEVTTSGYSAETIAAVDWTIGAGSGDEAGEAVAECSAVTFEMLAIAAGLTVYGYFVTDSTGLAWAERFTNPLTFGIGTDVSIDVTLRRTHRTQTA